MKNILNDAEMRFLASQGLGPEDVFDARQMPQWLWFQKIDEEGKTVALGSRCRKARHRLRSRRGHCVQCDVRKLAFQARYRAEQYVYIAGSLSKRIIKVGTSKDYSKRESRLQAERYGGAKDWRVICAVKTENAGAIEYKTHAYLSQYAFAAKYWKDGVLQVGIELLQCSFSVAKSALLQVLGDSEQDDWWESEYAFRYEFTP